MKAFFPHQETTEGITVRVAASFLPEQSDPARGRWFWTYHVRIENGSEHAVRLLTRHWIITDGRGARHQVDGEGVVGETPRIEPGEAYDYVSGCPLPTPTGSMRGHYGMAAADGGVFEVLIPIFGLTAPAVAR